MAACKPVFMLVTMLGLVSSVPSTSVSDLEQMVTILESNYRQETQKQEIATNSLLKELSKATTERQILGQTISQLQTQIQLQEQHYQGVVAGLLSKAAFTEDKLGNLTKDYDQLASKCNSDLNQLKKDLTSNVSSLTNSLAQSTKQGQDLMTEVSGLQKVLQSNRQKEAAFAGFLKQSTTFNKDDIVPFYRISFNLGDHYNTSTGIFTCPYSGVYVFHLHAMGPREGHFRLEIIKYGYGPGVYSGEGPVGYHHASNTNVLNMRAGDQMMVKSTMNQTRLLGGYTAFSGFLLYAD